MFRRCVDLRPYTTLKAGGRAELLAVAHCVEDLATAFRDVGEAPVTILGHGSNVLPSDAGVAGAVVVNATRRIEVLPEGEIVADSGCAFQDVFLAAAQAGLGGLEFAVGIPGTLGGALVSNAGAYRSNIGDHVEAIEIETEGERMWVDSSWIEFSYRDSKLRRRNAPKCVLLRVRLRLARSPRREIYEKARNFQRQRIGKQPPQASAGSFFKNVESPELAESLPSLPESLRKAGVVPAGYLLEEVGMKGRRVGGAKFAERHGNFIVNVGGATATDIRTLAGMAKRAVANRFGVELCEEVLYIGDWSAFGA